MDDAVSKPAHSLARAKELVAEGNYRLSEGSKARGSLLLELAKLEDAVDFVEVVFALVTDADYCGTVEIHTANIQGIYDEYVFEVPESVFEKFELRVRGWYLKFKLTQVRGQSVFVLSLHPLNKDEYRRKGGVLLRERD